MTLIRLAPSTLPTRHHPACVARTTDAACSHACALRARLAATAPSTATLRRRLARHAAPVAVPAPRAPGE